MSVEQNKALVRRRYDEIDNQHNLAAMDELVAQDYVHHDPSVPRQMLQGRDGYQRLALMFNTAFPDGHTTIEEMIAEGDLVATRFTTAGTHRGELMGVAATGRRVEVTATSIYRIADGKLAEGWVNFDALGLLQQIGALPAPAPQD